MERAAKVRLDPNANLRERIAKEEMRAAQLRKQIADLQAQHGKAVISLPDSRREGHLDLIKTTIDNTNQLVAAQAELAKSEQAIAQANEQMAAKGNAVVQSLAIQVATFGQSAEAAQRLAIAMDTSLTPAQRRAATALLDTLERLRQLNAAKAEAARLARDEARQRAEQGHRAETGSRALVNNFTNEQRKRISNQFQADQDAQAKFDTTTQEQINEAWAETTEWLGAKQQEASEATARLAHVIGYDLANAMRQGQSAGSIFLSVLNNIIAHLLESASGGEGSGSTGDFIGQLLGGVLQGIIGFNAGGVVPGAGSTDTVPAMLTPGEYVINKTATARHFGLLDRINRGGAPIGPIERVVPVSYGRQYYATGGLVTTSATSETGGSSELHVSLDHGLLAKVVREQMPIVVKDNRRTLRDLLGGKP